MFRATNIMEILRRKSVSSAIILAAIILTGSASSVLPERGWFRLPRHAGAATRS